MIVISEQKLYIYRLKVGINNDDPFRKYQVVSDQLVVNLLVAAKEITGIYLSTTHYNNYIHMWSSMR